MRIISYYKVIISFLVSLAISNSMYPVNHDRDFLLEIINKLEQGENIIFTKFGDGEYYCMIGSTGHNVDNDTYHSWLGESLKKALISLSRKPNTFIGKWHTAGVSNYCDSIAKGTSIPWVDYHLFMNDDEFYKFDYMRKFVNFVIHTPRKKIMLGNTANKRLKDFFRADIYIEIPPRNWSFEYDKWKNELEKHLVENCIVLIGGGMCSKVLINDITNIHKITCIDLGSSFDLLGSKQRTRAWHHSYEDELNYYKDFLPQNWD